jgi:hypothetical protein
LGNVLLVHRAGLVAFTNKYGGELPCDTTTPIDDRNLEVLDPEPIESIETDTGIEEHRLPGYENRPHSNEEFCNIIYQGFRNNAGNCPLDVYYAGMQPAPQGPMTCQEQRKFHLGLKYNPENFIFDWHSRYMFEGSYIGDTFVARLASNPDIMIDSYTMSATKVIDCPELKNQVIVKQAAVEGDGVLSGITTPNTTLADHLVGNFTNVGGGAKVDSVTRRRI